MNRVGVYIAAAAISTLLTAGPSFSQSSDNATVSAHSKIRIVRLSQTRGAVQVVRDDRPAEPAVNNLPIVEKARLETGMGVAEVEFEDNSTLRLAPDSAVEFPRLERSSNGGTLTAVRVTKGMVYVSLMKTPLNEFTLLAGSGSVQLMPASHVRVDLDGNKAQVAVLSGTARVNTPDGATDAAKKQSVSFNVTGGAAPALDRHVESNAFDTWDKKSADYHARVSSMAMYGNSPYSYGSSDMAYYGSFMNAGGCGSMWRPYFASASWEPYANGAWAWYQGAGYSWVSPYPWGWMPYHSGSWSYCDGVGWGWTPGGSWNGLNNGAMMMSIHGPGKLPTVPIHPPRVGEPAIHAVATQPVVKSEMTPGSAFVFRKDSAGLGVPREGFGKLSSFSRQAGVHGVASTPVYMEEHGPAMQTGRPSPVAITGSGIRAGSPPPAMPQPVNVGGRPVSGGGSMGSQRVSMPAPQGAPIRAK
jgi:hypothetical protein